MSKVRAFPDTKIHSEFLPWVFSKWMHQLQQLDLRNFSDKTIMKNFIWSFL